MPSKRRKTPRYSKEYIETASGVAWYDREQWRRLRQVAADPERLEESYDEWLAWPNERFATSRRLAC